tara:strand:+ start:1266 stop:1454 length:189 start_codon:yes stop_codon:yes gene_type:complete
MIRLISFIFLIPLLINAQNPNLPSGNLLSIFNILGQKQEIEYNKPLLYLYDNGKINKKIVID